MREIVLLGRLRFMDTIQYGDFAKVEIRIGLVKAAEVPEGSEKVIKLTVDFGLTEEGLGERMIFAGVKKWYEPEELVGKKLPFVVNLEPKKMGNLGYSQGMLMAAITKDEAGEQKPVLLLPDKEVQAGDKVV